MAHFSAKPESIIEILRHFSRLEPSLVVIVGLPKYKKYQKVTAEHQRRYDDGPWQFEGMIKDCFYSLDSGCWRYEVSRVDVSDELVIVCDEDDLDDWNREAGETTDANY